MSKYKITMRSGMTHEVEAKSESGVAMGLWLMHYSNWIFKEFEKQVVKIEKVTE